MNVRHPFFIPYHALAHCVNLTGKTGFLAGSCIPVIHMIGCCLINRLACEAEEGFCFLGIPCCNSIQNPAGSRAYTGFLSGILSMALGVGFYAKD